MEPVYQQKRLVRSYALSGNTLKISGTFEYKGEIIHFEVTWVRPGPAKTE